MRAEAAQEAAAQTKPAAATAPELAKPAASPKLSLVSTPEGADIEVDGSFMGNTPSVIELASGEHTISIKKAGYKSWERKVKLTGGEIKGSELEKNAEAPK